MGHSPSEVIDGLPLNEHFRGIPLKVTLRDGGRSRAIEAYEGEILVTVLKRAGLPLLMVCGGKGACGTCKVALPSGWATKLPQPSPRELRLLMHIKAKENERLSCRIPLTVDLDGLEVDACA